MARASKPRTKKPTREEREFHTAHNPNYDPSWKQWRPTPAERAQLYAVAEGLQFGRICYSANGSDIKNPPCNGWSSAFVIDKAGTRLVTVFCPYTLESFQVPRTSGDLRSMHRDYRYESHPNQPGNRTEVGYEDWTDERRLKMAGIVRSNWDMRMRLGMTADFDTAALVLRMLDAEVPLHVKKEGADDKPRGGKEADVLGLLKPVKRESKRGKVLEFFLPQPRSIREAMAEFGYSRSNVLSHLFILQKDHGIGYTLSGDAATITLPAGCTDPYAEGQ